MRVIAPSRFFSLFASIQKKAVCLHSPTIFDKSNCSLLNSSAQTLNVFLRNNFYSGLSSFFSSSSTMSGRLSGTVKWFDDKKGYGFISLENGNELHVHFSEIIASGFKKLRKGENIECEIGVDANGRESAKKVTGPNGVPIVSEERKFDDKNEF